MSYPTDKAVFSIMRIGRTYIEWHPKPWWGWKLFKSWSYFRFGHLLIARRHYPLNEVYSP